MYTELQFMMLKAVKFIKMFQKFGLMLSINFFLCIFKIYQMTFKLAWIKTQKMKMKYLIYFIKRILKKNKRNTRAI